MEIPSKTIPGNRMHEIEGVLSDANLIVIWRKEIPDWALVWELQTSRGRKILEKYKGTNVDIATEIINTFHRYYK